MRRPVELVVVKSRRELLLALGALPIFGQGVSTRTARPTPRGKPSGLPFHSKLTDIAAEAGLRAPVIYGGVDHKTYIIETVGCGVAFIDYDNDGWLDIFILSGKRWDEDYAGEHESAVSQ